MNRWRRFDVETKFLVRDTAYTLALFPQIINVPEKYAAQSFCKKRLRVVPGEPASQQRRANFAILQAAIQVAARPRKGKIPPESASKHRALSLREGCGRRRSQLRVKSLCALQLPRCIQRLLTKDREFVADCYASSCGAGRVNWKGPEYESS